MIDACDEDTKSKLTNGEIVADCVEFLLAGYETTGTALTFLTYQLAAHPDVQDRLFTEVEDYFQENEVRCVHSCIVVLMHDDNYCTGWGYITALCTVFYG